MSFGQPFKFSQTGRIIWIYLLSCNVFSMSEAQGQDGFCCWKASGSCRTVCEQISLAGIAGDPVLREESLVTLHNFCSEQLTSFWQCVNDTLTEIRRGEEWTGRRCCHLSQTGKCRRTCTTATSRQNLTQSCRQSDEIVFFTCLHKQEYGDECCANARSADCLEACKMSFRTSLTPSQEIRSAVTEYCGETSPKVLNCIKNITKVTPVTNGNKFLQCCNQSNEPKCRETCKTVLQTKTTGQEIVDGLQEGGCGPPLPHDTFWQCFLQTGSPTKISPLQNSVSRIDQMGIDSAKLHCCNKAGSNSCRRLCIKTFSDEWTVSWKDFDRECLSDLHEDKLLHCLEEVEEPCELGCDGLSYCTNFNNRPVELFRSCNAQADDAARYDVTLWQQQGFLSLPGGIQVLVKNISKCSPSMWKAVACALQIKPCHRQTHANRICREDCYEVLSQCIDWSRMPSTPSAATLCSRISPDKSSGTCISLRTFLEPNDYPYMEPEAEITAPCRGEPCGSNKICLINRNCPQGKPCQTYTCVPGCKMGEISQFIIPYDSYVRIPVPSENKGCQKICQCTPHGIIENCQPMPCVPFDNCWLGNKKIHHGSWFFLDCNVCSCLSGEITCSRKQCKGSSTIDGRIASFTTLPCNCPLHHVPVCGRNGNTYPNSCLAKCAGLKDADFEFGPCSTKDPCETQPCGEGFKCIPFKKVCLSLLEKPCKQYECVDLTLTCTEIPFDPVCDTEQKEHYNMCAFAKSGKVFAYKGSCLSNCQNEGPVCGIDGETYRSQCSARANFVLVDYEGPCSAVGLISDEAKSQCGTTVGCPRLPSTGCYAVTPPGACCPICAGALRLLFSRKQIDRALYALRGIPTNSLTVSGILGSLERQIQIAECSLWGFLTFELDIFVAVVPQWSGSKVSELQREVCVREAEKLASLVRKSSPRILSDLGLSSLTAATVVHTFTNSGYKVITISALIWIPVFMYHVVT